MTLLEIALTKHVKKADVYWQGIFEDHGWHFLGTGAEGSVARHPRKPYVLKVFIDRSPYLQFLKWVESRPKDPHLPRINRWARPVPGSRPPRSYVRMEELKPVSVQTLLNRYGSELVYTWIAARKYGTTVSDYWDSGLTAIIGRKVSVVSLEKEIADHDLNWWQNPNNPLWQSIGRMPLLTWMRTMDSFFAWWSAKSPGSRVDIHGDNVMLRGSTLVLIDPVAMQLDDYEN
jgi:hypothetical protein